MCAALLPDFGTIKAAVAVGLWRTFALARKTSGTVNRPVSFSSIEDSSSSLSGCSVCVGNGSPASCRILLDALEVSVLPDLFGSFEGFSFCLQ
jgi:hypothetical protein